MASQWPELIPDDDQHPRRTLVRSLTAAVVGGAAGWTLFYVGLGLWGLAIGAALVILLPVLSNRLEMARTRSESIAMSLAISMLAWPLLWVAAVSVRYWVTGQTVGN